MGWLNINDPTVLHLQTSCETLRPGARAGLWCGFILPIALLISATAYRDHVSLSFLLAVATSWVCSMYLFAGIFNKKKLFAHVSIVVATITLNKFILFLDLQTTIRITCIAVLCSVKSFQALNHLLEHFPLSFSLGEAMLAVQGAISFLVVALSNCLNETTATPSTTFSQVLLLSTVIFLLLVGKTVWLQEFIHFIISFLLFLGLVTLPVIWLLIGQNPIWWFFMQFIFVSIERVFVLLFWSLCSVIALAITWRYGDGTSTQALTILRKYFHAVVVAIYLPGVLFDMELLFNASLVVLAGFLFLEAIRLLGREQLGDVLNQKMSAFLDEKDSGKLILTHTYLLVGCSLPIWLFPLDKPNNGEEVLLLCSGVISLGIGDAAASIGGTLWGKTKIFGRNKSLEGLLSSIAAEMFFVILLYLLGVIKMDGTLYLLFKFFAVAAFTSVIEASTTQVDNLVLPLVMYTGLLL